MDLPLSKEALKDRKQRENLKANPEKCAIHLQAEREEDHAHQKEDRKVLYEVKDVVIN